MCPEGIPVKHSVSEAMLDTFQYTGPLTSKERCDVSTSLNSSVGCGAIKSDHSLSEKDREGKVQGILAELGILTSQLTTTTNDLHRTENEMKLSSSMKKLSNSLSAPRD
jgi:hypothetical protein